MTKGKGIYIPKKEDTRKAYNAKRRHNRLVSNPTKWELEQLKMKQLQEEFILCNKIKTK